MQLREAAPHFSTLRQLPAEDRPRERLARVGASALSNPELLAILLGTGRPGESALAIGARLASPGLRGLAGRSLRDLSREPGVGRAAQRGAEVLSPQPHAPIVVAEEYAERLIAIVEGRGFEPAFGIVQHFTDMRVDGPIRPDFEIAVGRMIGEGRLRAGQYDEADGGEAENSAAQAPYISPQ